MSASQNKDMLIMRNRRAQKWENQNWVSSAVYQRHSLHTHTFSPSVCVTQAFVTIAWQPANENTLTSGYMCREEGDVISSSPVSHRRAIFPFQSSHPALSTSLSLFWHTSRVVSTITYSKLGGSRHNEHWGVITALYIRLRLKWSAFRLRLGFGDVVLHLYNFIISL